MPAPARVAAHAGEDERYRLLDEVGSGAMGVVYTAWDRSLDRKVALKLLHDRFLGGESQARLRAEAQTMARLSHPNVVPVYDVGEREGRTFFAMELVAGDPLDEWLKTERTWRDVVAAFVDAGRGLAAAHAAGIVHRDFKPSNVLVGDDGRVRVADFGVARAIGSVLDEQVVELSANAVVQTVSGAVVGTPAYMAPEQLRGERVDARADQFAFCVSLFEALAGERPFGGDTIADRLAAIGRGVPALDADVPPWLVSVVARGLAADPNERFETVDDMVRALRGPAPSQRRRIGLALGAGAAIAGVIGYVAFGSTSAAEPCANLERELAGVWDDDRRAELTASLSGAGVAADGVELVTGPLDRYAGAWMEMRTDACSKTHDSGDQTAYVLDLRLRCLSLRRVELGVAAEQIADLSGDDSLSAAIGLATSLTPLDACADVDALAAVTPLPLDPEARAAIARVREQVVRGRAMLDITHPQASAKDTVDAAVATGYPPAIAEARVLYAVRLRQSGDRGAAEREVRAAAQAAADGNDDRALADAWIELGQNLVWRGRIEEVAGVLAAAEPVVMGTGDYTLAAAFHNLSASVAESRGRTRDAIDHMRRAVDHMRSSGEPARVDLAKYEFRIAYLSEWVGDMQTAVDMVRAGIDRYRLVFGGNDPRIVTGQTTLAHALTALGQLDEARAVALSAIANAEQTLEWKRPDMALLTDATSALGNVELARSDIAAARAAYERALELAVADADDVGRVDALIGMGRVAERSGDGAAHARRCSEAFALATESAKSDFEPRLEAEAALCLSRAVAASGDTERAIDLAGRALEAADAVTAVTVGEQARAQLERLGSQ